MSRFPLPPLRPPVDELIALLEVPPTAKLHIPVELHLIVRNRHRSRAANLTVHLETDSLDGFVVAGLRNGRMPILLPGSEERVTWKLIPVDCGFVKVPRVRIVNRRKSGATAAEAETEGMPVQIVDVRWDDRSESGEEGPRASLNLSVDGGVSRLGSEPSILVLP